MTEEETIASQTKLVRLSLALTPKQYDDVRTLAQIRKVTPSALMRSLIDEAAEKNREAIDAVRLVMMRVGHDVGRIEFGTDAENAS